MILHFDKIFGTSEPELPVGCVVCFSVIGLYAFVITGVLVYYILGHRNARVYHV